MIWNGKRYKGVQVYVGKQSGDFAGEYIVVYKCNGITRKLGGGVYYDAACGLRKGDIIPNVMSTIWSELLVTDYREVSQRKIPEDIQRKLDKWVNDD